MRARPLLLACLLSVLLASPSRATVLFSEDFSDNVQGWTLGPEWQIGPATASSGQSGSTFPDPSADHSPSGDNGVAGTVIGGNITTGVHGIYQLASPAIDLSSVSGAVELRFWRWLNLDYPPYMTGRVQVFDGVSWITLFESTSGTVSADNEWSQFTYDVTAYKNANFRVRFTHEVGSSGAFIVSGWNVDDVEIATATTTCNDDLDGDTYIAVSCGGNDCDDTDDTIHPGAWEACDAIDNNCDGQIDEPSTIYRDFDGDGYGDPATTSVYCGLIPGYVFLAGDCDDSRDTVHPGAPELCDGLDNNCDGNLDEGFAQELWFRDQDGDGFGFGLSAVYACAAPPGYVSNWLDCQDSDSLVHPGAIEICDGLDNDCNGSIDEGLTIYYFDHDGDGFGSADFGISCTLDYGFVANNLDCDDNNSFDHPGAVESCDGRDNDCDGVIDNNCAYLTLESIRDVKNDQGRAVRLTWVRALNDSAQSIPTQSYTIWRRIDGEFSAAELSRARATRGGDSDSPDAVGAWQAETREGVIAASGRSELDPARAGRPEVNDLPPGNWDFIAYVPALQLQRYHFVAPTLCDSNSAGICWSTFFVRADRGYGLVEYSPQDSGYSVDNIVPGVPQGLIASLVPGGHHLDWSDSHDADFQYYRVYRGSDPGFVPGPGNLVQSTASSAWTDPTVAPFLYKVTTVDANGNESAPAATALVTGVEDGASAALGFAAVSPNPFRGELSCSIVVPSGGADVTLRVLDLAGRTVRTLASSRLAPGRHTLSWDGRDTNGRRVAPGVYMLRLSGVGSAQIRRVSYTP